MVSTQPEKCDVREQRRDLEQAQLDELEARNSLFPARGATLGSKASLQPSLEIHNLLHYFYPATARHCCLINLLMLQGLASKGRRI